MSWMAIEIPIFPLDNVVLFPKVRVPLYIFEPRYRQMTAAALEGDGRIGMVVVRPDHRSEMVADPPVFPVGCAGTIGHAQSHEDGTYHIILEGNGRFVIEEELPPEGDRLYRIARVSMLEDEEAAPDSLPPIRDRVLSLVRSLAPDRADQLDASTFASLDDVTFVNAFSQSLDFTTLEKQQLIEANGVLSRGEQLIALLEFRIAEHATAGPSRSGTVH
jgi:Lon protease-like protein